MWAKIRKSLSGIGSSLEEASNDSACVKVAVRVRPLVASEERSKAQPCISTDEKENCVWVGSVRRFTYDHVFGPNSAQEDVYRTCVSELVHASFLGINSTVFAFGQTSSGKTFTMGSAPLASHHNCGIIPRVLQDMYRLKAQAGQGSTCSIRIQYLEIHNEEIKDLLHPDLPAKSIALRETTDGKILVVGAADEPADCEEEALRLLELGSLSRSTGTTNMNEHSSRSHAIFTVLLEQRVEMSDPVGENTDPNAGSGTRILTAKFHLVDLAGSERAKKTGAAGLRLKESVTINGGLLALGNVISALSTESRRRAAHVPYRTSKLTRLLQDSLGGNSRTVMLACVTCADTHLEESLNTLKYAQRARYIKNKPLVNQELRPISAPEKAMRITSEDSELVLAPIGEDGEKEVGESGGERSAAAVSSKPQHNLFTANQQNRWLRSQMASLQEGVARAGAMEKAMSESIAELHSRGELSSSARGRLTSILSSLQVMGGSGEWRAAAPGEKAEDGPRRSGTVSSGLRSLLPTKAAQAFRSDTLTLQSRIRQLERELGEKGEEAAKYRRLLQEAQEDLAQDEVIFADKMKELKVAQQEIARLKASASAGSNAFNAAQPDTCRQVGGLPILGKDGPSSRGQVREAEGALEGSAAGELAPEDSDLVLLGDRNPSPDPGTAEITPAAALRAARASLDMQLKELMYNIQRKEELIGQLRENEARAHSLSNQYMDRVKEVEEEVKGKESTIRLMQEKLASLETDRRHSLEEKRQLRSHFQAKIGTVTAQLTSLQKQLKERSTGQVAERERERAQARAKQLEEEVASMRRQHESLHSRLREVNQKFEKAAAGWAKEAGELRKKSFSARQKARSLELDLRTARAALQRKQEEVAALQERLGELRGGTPAEGATSRMRSRTSHAARRRTAPELADSRLASSAAPPLDMAWLEAAVQKLVARAEAQATLHHLSSRQASLLADKAKAEQELLEGMEEGGEAGSYRDPECDDSRMEALQLQLEVVSEALEQAEKTAAAGTAAELELGDLGERGLPAQMQAALAICMRVIGERTVQNRESAARVATLEASLAEREGGMAALGHRLRLKEVEFERRMTLMAQQHEAKVASLLQELAKVAPPSSSSRVFSADEEVRSSRDSSPGSPSKDAGPEVLSEKRVVSERKAKELSLDDHEATSGNGAHPGAGLGHSDGNSLRNSLHGTSHFSIPASRGPQDRKKESHRAGPRGSAGGGSTCASKTSNAGLDPQLSGHMDSGCGSGAGAGASRKEVQQAGNWGASGKREFRLPRSLLEPVLHKESFVYAEEDAAWLHFTVE